ncbi:MAG: hypothetical protein JNL21_22660 [Myxococcales bacterium]|nr:hypothetical protein [Myxococcales bacterium]
MIDTSGRWWKGSDPGDIAEYLKLLIQQDAAETPHKYRSVLCACGGEVFNVRFDRSEGFSERRCTACGSTVHMLDSAESLKDARPKKWRCQGCRGTQCNLGVWFSMVDADTVRWVYIGSRCTQCGTLGCYVDWKVMYGPSRDLLDAV